MPIPSGFVSHIDLLDPLCYPGSGLIIEDLASPSTVWNISASGATYNSTVGALSLTTQSIEADSQLINTGDGAITIAGWVNINQYSYGTSFNCLPAVGKALGGNQFKQLALYGSVPNAIGLGNCSNGSGFVYGNVESPINTWVFVVVKKNTGQTVSQYKTYINGAPNEAGYAGSNTTTSIAYNGTFSYGLINGTIFGEGAATFPMTVSQFWMYNSYLSDADVLDLYNATVNRYYPPTPVASYDVSNPASYSGTGNTLFDLTNSYDITLTNAPAYITYDNFKSLQFLEASSQFGQYSGSVGINTTTPVFTFSTWLKPISLSPEAYNVLIGYGKETGPSTGGAAMILNKFLGSNELVPTFGSGKADIRTGDPVALGTWVNLVTTSDGTTYKVYVNGVFIDSTPLSGAQIGTPEYLRINGLPDNTPLKGNFELATLDIYTEALDAGTILQNYDDTKLQYAFPIAEYDFQNGSYPGSGTSVLDLSGTGNTLAITSGGTWVSGTPNYFDLNGDTAIYKSPALGGIASTNVFTINGWYYLPTTVLNSVVLDVGKDIANQSAQIASGFSLGELFASGGFGYGVLEYTGAAQPGWNFISYVSTGSSSTAYLNGASVGSTTNVPSLPSDAGIIIGTALNNASPPVPRLDLAAVGRVGYFDVYNVALGSTEITNIYNATSGSYAPPPPSTSNVGGRQFAQGFNG